MGAKREDKHGGTNKGREAGFMKRRGLFGEPTRCAQQVQLYPKEREHSRYLQAYELLKMLLAIAADGPSTLKII